MILGIQNIITPEQARDLYVAKAAERYSIRMVFEQIGAGRIVGEKFSNKWFVHRTSVEADIACFKLMKSFNAALLTAIKKSGRI